MKDLTIGSKVLVLHRDYMLPKKQNGIIRSARITGFKNNQGFLEPLFKIVGHKDELAMGNYLIFIDMQIAINFLM
jgi:hypothetical protein